MGLEEEFGLFKRTNGNGRLFKNGMGVGIISGRPKRKLRRIITRPVGFLLKPITREAKRRARKRVKGIFERPKRLTTEEILEREQKAILKGLKKKKVGKRRAKEIRRLEREFM